jgi:hypothetical protein
VQIDLSPQNFIRQCKEMFVKEPQSSRQFRASSKSLLARGFAPIEICFTRVHGERQELKADARLGQRANKAETSLRKKPA